MVNQDTPHNTGGHREEMRPILPINVLASRETNEDFVNDGGRLESMIISFSPKLQCRNAAQIVVNEWDQFVGCFTLACMHPPQEFRNIHRAVIHCKLELYCATKPTR
jgi:hypothetical protein